jgi:hypothetical protein
LTRKVTGVFQLKNLLWREELPQLLEVAARHHNLA